jgi:hypothetical protein
VARLVPLDLPVSPNGSIIIQSGDITASAKPGVGQYILDFGSAVAGKLILVSSGRASDPDFRGMVSAGPCGGTVEGAVCPVGILPGHLVSARGPEPPVRRREFESRWGRRALAQLGERLPYKQEVGGSKRGGSCVLGKVAPTNPCVRCGRGLACSSPTKHDPSTS